MTTQHHRLTDALLRQALAELAAGPDSGRLVGDVLRSIESTQQVRGTTWPPRLGWRQLAIVAATALLLVTLVGSIALLSGVLPDPLPVPGPTLPTPSASAATILPGTADMQLPPFSYAVPQGSGLVRSTAPTALIQQFTSGPRGVLVFRAVGGAHCGSEGPPMPVRPSPREFLEDVESAGIELGDISDLTIDGRPAAMVEIDGAAVCTAADLHLDGVASGAGGISRFQTTVKFYNASEVVEEPAGRFSRLIVVDVNGAGVAMLVWAPNADWETWLPVAMEFVESIRFE
jgi:hypothetical protein